MKKQPPKVEPAKAAECPAWMMTFGDCMSLLVCFFVMLIAFSNMEEQHLAAMIGAMRGALGGIEPISEPIIKDKIEADGLTTIVDDTEEIKFAPEEEIPTLMPHMISELRLSLRDDPTAWPDRLIIRMMEDGLAIVIHTRDLFVNGTSALREEDQLLWQGIANLLRDRDNTIRIMVQLDSNTTVESEQIRSVWGLGLERAQVVAMAMQNTMGATASRFGIGVQISENDKQEALEITILGAPPTTSGDQIKQEWLLEAWR